MPIRSFLIPNQATPNNVSAEFGTGGRLRYLTAANAADGELAGFILGTSDHQGTAAGSIVLSNITSGGDVQGLINVGGNSLEWLLVDNSARQIFLGFGVFDTIIPDGNGIVIGHSAQVTLGDLGETQILGTANGDAMLVIGRFSADANPTRLAFLKSRHATLGSNTIVNDGDVIARVVAYGADGTDFASISSQIDFTVDGTPGVGDMPGRIVISTSRDGAESPTEVARFNAQQAMLFSNAGPAIGEPTANPVDRAGFYCIDLSAGNATLGILTETAVATEAALASTHTLAVRINGATYRILLTNA